MEERKTAAIVLGVLAFIAFIFLVLIPYIKSKETQTLAFKNCSVNFSFDRKFYSDSDAVCSAENKLALCLCKAYSTIPTKSVGDQIVKIYKRYRSYQAGSLSRLFYPLDSILKHKKAVFDTVILVD